jgi:PncC family amidohydrolase
MIVSVFMTSKSHLVTALKNLDVESANWSIQQKMDRMLLVLKGQDSAVQFGRLRDALGEHRVRRGDVRLVEVLHSTLKMRRETVAVAESCTGGLLSKLLTDRSGSSEIFLGGAVVYSNEAKVNILDANAEEIEKKGAVSKEVVASIAAGAARVFGSDYGIGISGVAGPTGGTKEKPVGTVWIGVYGKRKRGKQLKFHFNGTRTGVRLKAALAAMLMLERFIFNPDELDIIQLW